MSLIIWSVQVSNCVGVCLLIFLNCNLFQQTSHFSLFLCPPALIQVGFEFSVYSTAEGQGSVEVCASILNSANVTTQFFTVQLFAQDNTAIGTSVFLSVK